jgi:hypothetical protein
MNAEELEKVLVDRGAYDVWFPESWTSIIEEIHNKLVGLDPKYRTIQIKQKFGGLRFYFSTENYDHAQEMQDFVDQKESQSYKICIDCGKPSTKYSGFYAVCDKH